MDQVPEGHRPESESGLTQVDFSHLASLEGFMRAACRLVHKGNKRWWIRLEDSQPLERNVGEMLMLAVSELAEAMEGHRKGLMDDHLPGRQMLEVELADCVIRVMDLAEGLGLDLAGAWRDKMEYNAKRLDHTRAARLAEGGKKY